MKKLSIVLIVVLCFALVACGGSKVDVEAVEEQLFGIWRLYEAHPEGTIDSAYIFAQGEVACMANISGFEQTTKGTYEINKDTITIKYDNGITFDFDYTYKDDVLRIYSDDTELTQINGAGWN